MITVLYFASLREELGTDREELELGDITNASDLLQHLRQRDEKFGKALAESKRTNISINQEMAKVDADIKDGDEVAFFPPVTGG